MTLLRASRALPLAALALVLLPGCSTFRSLFPKREEVFKPIVPTLGTPLVQGSDTVYVLEGAGYDVVTRRRELLVEARSALARAVRSYVRYFGSTPPSVRAALVAVDPRRHGGRPEADSALTARDGPRALLLVPAIGGRNNAMVGTVNPTPVVYRWIEERYGGEAALAPADTVNGRALAWRDHPKLPDWIEVALPELVAGSSRADMLIGRLAAQTSAIMPLRDLLSGMRPREVARGDEGVQEAAAEAQRMEPRRGRPPEGGRPPLTGALLFDANALSFGRFLLQREGASFIGATADVLAGGVPADTVLARATGNPPLSTLDAEWRAWVARQQRVGRGPR